MEKILSIIIPTYNMEKYLHRCLDSLIIEEKQLFDSIEVLIINDGSKDSSSVIAHEYERLYANVFRVIDKENGNYGSCINRGIAESQGKYIKVLDADDWFDKKGLSKLVLYLLSSDSDLCITNYQQVNEEQSVIREISIPTGKDGCCVPVTSFDWKKQADPLLLSMHAFCVKCDLLRSNNYKQQTGISYTDTEFNFFCLLYSRTIAFLDVCVYNYLIGREGQTISPAAAAKSSNHYWKVAKRLIDYYLNNINHIDSRKKETLLIPITKVSQSYFFTELFIKCKKDIDTQTTRQLIRLNENSGIDINLYKYHSLNYVSIYKTTGVSFHWLYRIVSFIKKR